MITPEVCTAVSMAEGCGHCLNCNVLALQFDLASLRAELRSAPAKPEATRKQAAVERLAQLLTEKDLAPRAAGRGVMFSLDAWREVMELVEQARGGSR